MSAPKRPQSPAVPVPGEQGTPLAPALVPVCPLLQVGGQVASTPDQDVEGLWGTPEPETAIHGNLGALSDEALVRAERALAFAVEEGTWFGEDFNTKTINLGILSEPDHGELDPFVSANKATIRALRLPEASLAAGAGDFSPLDVIALASDSRCPSLLRDLAAEASQDLPEDRILVFEQGVLYCQTEGFTAPEVCASGPVQDPGLERNDDWERLPWKDGVATWEEAGFTIEAKLLNDTRAKTDLLGTFTDVFDSTVVFHSKSANTYPYFRPQIGLEEHAKGLMEMGMIKYVAFKEAAKYVQEDYQRACTFNEAWHYQGVVVTASLDGVELGRDSLWGVESDCGWRYQDEVARDCAGVALGQAKKAYLAKQAATQRPGLISLTGTLAKPTGAAGYGVVLDAEELAAILAEVQAHDVAMGYAPRTALDVNQIAQELVWKAEEEGLDVPDDTDPDPRPGM